MNDSAAVARLRNEASTLRALLARTPGGVARRSLVSRLEAVEVELARARSIPGVARVDLLFEGGPVIGSVGIEVGFIAHALDPIGRAVDAEVQAHRPKTQPGKDAAPFPKLFVTEQLQGSFGFRLEELRQLPIPFEGPAGESELSRAVARIAQAIVEAPNREDWDRELSPGALNGLKAFFQTMKGRSVSLRLAHRDTTALLDPDAIRLAAEAMDRVEISETEDWLDGTLSGVEREANEFEFVVEDDVLRGQISDGLDYDGQVRPLLDSQCRALVKTTTRKHPSRTTRRYTLIDIQPR